MKPSFSITIQNILFRFQTLNPQKLQLFRVHASIDETEERFYMELGFRGKFIITDRGRIPDYIGLLESELSDAIFANATEV